LDHPSNAAVTDTRSDQELRDPKNDCIFTLAWTLALQPGADTQPSIPALPLTFDL
jgi:hypothetical protein